MHGCVICVGAKLVIIDVGLDSERLLCRPRGDGPLLVGVAIGGKDNDHIDD